MHTNIIVCVHPISLSRMYTHTHTHTFSQVQETLNKQPQLLQRITTASTQFEQLTAGQSVGVRETKLKELATGYDAFQQLCSNITEGTKVSRHNGTSTTHKQTMYIHALS